MKHIICYSGGHESALVAIDVARKRGTKNMILLNHNISPEVEDQDIKQYKLDIADYLGLDVTPCNASEKFPHLDPIKACMDIKAFKVRGNPELCCAKIKTEPFHAWLKKEFSRHKNSCVIYYGFPKSEPSRIERREDALGDMGYKVNFPLLSSGLSIHDTAEIGIPKPKHYENFIHGNCNGCLKAGWQHWYCTFCRNPERWELGKKAEKFIGYSISRRGGKPCYLKEREEEFAKLKALGLPATEHINSGKFWAMARKLLKNNPVTLRRLSLSGAKGNPV